MKVERQNTKLKRGTCVTIALLIVMTAITAMACMPNAAPMHQANPGEIPVATETQPEQEEISTDEGYNYLFVEGGEVNEDGSIAIDISDLDLEEGLNLISFSDPMSGEDLNIKLGDTEAGLKDINDINYIFADNFKVNEDGTIAIDISDLDLKEGLNLIGFCDSVSGEETIDPEFSYTPSEDEAVDEEMFVQFM